MKLLRFLAVFVALGSVYTLAIAADDHAQENRVDHYKGQVIETPEQAIQALKNYNSEIADILKAKRSKGSDLEKIHEISYTLETAIDKLISDKAGSAEQLEAINEAVQAIHYASENHEEAKVREWFTKLEAAVANLKETPTTTMSKNDGVYEIVIKDHHFTPDEIHVPAGKKIKLIVHNQDPTPEEFESDDFRREKIIAGNSTATILVGPLKPGKYHFFGEFNLDKANGYLIAE